MANIAITTYCNLHCPYCFANTMIKTEDIKNISLDQFKKILNWIGEDNEKIGLIGGEPTLHPQFKEILQIINEYTDKCQHKPGFVLFTNGVYLDKYIQYIPSNMCILINVNQPRAMSTAQYASMINNIRTLEKLGWLNMTDPFDKITLGCNICQEIDDYNFIWDILKRFKIKRLRMSVVAPTKIEQLKNKDEYYNSMKNKFLDFVQYALKNEVTLIPDCSQIPMCYFSHEEIIKINAVLPAEEKMHYPFCDPVLDITPDFKASSCFGAYELIDCKNFENIRELERYARYKIMFPKILNNCGGKCKNCEMHEFLKCQGGCLAFGQK